MNKDSQTQRKLELPAGVEIIQPTLDDISPELRQQFAERLVEGTYSRLGPELDEGNKTETAENFRMTVRDLLGSMQQRVKSESELWQKARDRAYPTNTVKDETEGYIKSIERMLEKGELLAIRKDGKVVSIIAIRDAYIKWPDGRDCFEIGKAATLSEECGQGLYKILANEAAKQLKEKHPDAPILRGTKNPRVKKHLLKAGWKEVPFDYGMDDPNVDKDSLDYKLAKSYRESIDSFSPLVTKKWIRDGYSIFYFDPKATT